MSYLDHPTLAINNSLQRLPLVLDILDEIETGADLPGDEDLRHGSHQAVRRMVERLQRVEPNHMATNDQPPARELEIANTWLLGERPKKLLPPTLYEELCRLIQKLIPGDTAMMDGQQSE
jgi:hypothetical protein